MKKITMNNKAEIALLRGKNKKIYLYFSDKDVALEVAKDLAGLFGLINNGYIELPDRPKDRYVLTITKTEITITNCERVSNAILKNPNNTHLNGEDLLREDYDNEEN